MVFTGPSPVTGRKQDLHNSSLTRGGGGGARKKIRSPLEVLIPRLRPRSFRSNKCSLRRGTLVITVDRQIHHSNRRKCGWNRNRRKGGWNRAPSFSCLLPSTSSFEPWSTVPSCLLHQKFTVKKKEERNTKIMKSNKLHKKANRASLSSSRPNKSLHFIGAAHSRIATSSFSSSVSHR